MGPAPRIDGSTQEERRTWIRDRYPCMADCDACGICASFHGKDAETAFASYIAGDEEMLEVALRLRGRSSLV